MSWEPVIVASPPRNTADCSYSITGGSNPAKPNDIRLRITISGKLAKKLKWSSGAQCRIDHDPPLGLLRFSNVLNGRHKWQADECKGHRLRMTVTWVEPLRSLFPRQSGLVELKVVETGSDGLVIELPKGGAQ